MFFHASDFSVKLLTVMELHWGHVQARVDARPFHALAFRLTSGTTLSSQGRAPLVSEAGDLSFTPAGCAFQKQAEQDRIIVVHFTADAPLPTEICRLHPGDPGHFQKQFQRLLQVWTDRQTGWEHEAKMVFYGILLSMEQEWVRQESPETEERLSPALRMIHDRFADRNLSVEELSKHLGMSDTYFRKLFVASTGETPLRYICRLRMDRATELLRSSYYSMDQIAERCGFATVNYFSLFVKKETGLSPSAYRKKLLSAE